MGFLFKVQDDWSGERFTAQIAVNVRQTRRINTPDPLGNQSLQVQKWPEVFSRVYLCPTPTRRKHGQPVSFSWTTIPSVIFFFKIYYWLLKGDKWGQHVWKLAYPVTSFCFWVKTHDLQIPMMIFRPCKDISATWPCDTVRLVCLQRTMLPRDLKAQTELLDH